MAESLKDILGKSIPSYKNSWDDVYCYDDDGKIDIRSLFARQDMNQKVDDHHSDSDGPSPMNVRPITGWTEEVNVNPYSAKITHPETTYATISSCTEPENINITCSAMDLKKIGIPILADARTTYDVKFVKNGSGYILKEVTATLDPRCFPPPEINDILKKDEEKETMPTKDDVMKFVWKNINSSSVWTPINHEKEKEPDPTHRKYPALIHDLRPKRIIFNNPATIVFWEDGTKTVVKLSKGEKFNSYNAFCAALAKKIFENNSRVRAIVKSGVNQHMKDANKKKTKKTSKK